MKPIKHRKWGRPLVSLMLMLAIFAGMVGLAPSAMANTNTWLTFNDGSKIYTNTAKVLQDMKSVFSGSTSYGDLLALNAGYLTSSTGVSIALSGNKIVYKNTSSTGGTKSYFLITAEKDLEMDFRLIASLCGGTSQKRPYMIALYNADGTRKRNILGTAPASAETFNSGTYDTFSLYKAYWNNPDTDEEPAYYYWDPETTDHVYDFTGSNKLSMARGESLFLSIQSCGTRLADGVWLRPTLTLEINSVTAKVTNYTVGVTQTTGGTVSVNKTTVEENGTATFTATPSTGYHFVKWSDNSTANPYNKTITANTTLSATFAKNTYTVAAAAQSGGTAKVNNAASATVEHGGSASFSATANTGYTFAGWYNGSTFVSNNNPYTLNNVTAATTLTAHFTLNSYSVTASVDSSCSGMGTASVTPASVNHGSTATFTAAPASGYEFVGWYNDASKVSGEATYRPTITSALNLTAKFQKINVTVTFANGTGGTYTVVGGGINQTISSASQQITGWMNTSVTLTASPSSHYHIKEWYAGGNPVQTGGNTFTFTLGTYSGQTVTPVWEQDAQIGMTLVPPAAGTGTITVNSTTPSSGNVTIYNFSDVSVPWVATPAQNYHFVRWYNTGNSSTINGGASMNTTLLSGASVSAEFAPDYTTQALAASVKGGSYTVKASGSSEVLKTVGNLSDSFDRHYSTAYVLTAVPENKYSFVKWSDGVTTAERTIAAGADWGTIYPVFHNDYVSQSFPAVSGGSYTVTKSGESTPAATITTQNADVEGYYTDTYVVEATADYYHTFNNWVNAANGNVSTDNPYTIGTLTAGATVKPYFVDHTASQDFPAAEGGSYTITAGDGSGRSQTITDAATFTGRNDVEYTLTATPDTGYHFVEWVNGQGARISSETSVANYTLNETAGLHPVFASDFVAQTFRAVEGVTYSITGVTTPGTAAQSVTITDQNVEFTGLYNETYTLTLVSLEDFYRFQGWYKPGGIQAGSNQTLEGITLNATDDIAPQATYYGATLTLLPGEGGSYTLKDGATTLETVSNATLTRTLDREKVYTLTAAPANGQKFIEWRMNGACVSRTAEYTLRVSDGDQFQPVFAKADAALYQVESAYYAFFDEAIAAAQQTGKEVYVCDDGVMYNSDGANEFLIPTGVKVIVPHTNDGASLNDGPSSSAKHPYAYETLVADMGATATPAGNAFRTLTVPENAVVDVRGVLAVGGTLNGHGAPAGGQPHANLYLSSGAVVNVGDGASWSSGYLTNCGFVYGPGHVNVIKGGEIYAPFAANDFRGGGYTVGVASKIANADITIQQQIDHPSGEQAIMPFSRYSMVGIQSRQNIAYGGKVFGYVDLYAQSSHNCSNIGVIGNTTNYILSMANGSSVTVTYDAAKTVNVNTAVGRTKIQINGNASLGGFIVRLTGWVTASVDMREVNFYVPYNYDIEIVSGTFTVGNKAILLPGATLTVDEGAALNVSSNSQLTVYDGLTDYTASLDVENIANKNIVLNSYASQAGVSGFNVAVPSRTYPTTADLKRAGLSGAAELIVNGTLNLSSGSCFGGIVQTGGSGSITVDANATLSTTTQIGAVGRWYYNDLTYKDYEHAGATVHTLSAQVFDPTTGKRTDLVKGQTYTGQAKDDVAIDSFSYTLYYADANKTTYSKEITETVTIPMKGSFYNYEVTVHSGDDTRKEYYAHGADVSKKEYFTADSNGTKVDAITSADDLYEVHTWGETNYVWAEDNSSVTASRSCTVCGETETETETVNTTSKVTIDPTCTEKGKTTYTATFNNAAFETQTKVVENVDALGHDLKATEAKDATCTELGNSAYWTCSRCGKYFSDAEGKNEIAEDSWVIAATGHNLEKTEAHAATCTEAGNSEYYTCSRCEKYFSDAAGTTEIAENNWVIEALGHSFTNYVYNDDATCEVDGTETAKCDRCDETDTRTKTGSALGHDYHVTWEWTGDDANGYTKATAVFTCSRDAGHVERVDALEISSVTEPAGHETAGSTVYTATATFNGETYTDKRTVAISATGHTYGEPVWTWNDDHTEATATFTCSEHADAIQRVTATYNETDSPITVTTVAASCKATGSNTYVATVTFLEKTYTSPNEVVVIPTVAHTLKHFDRVDPTCEEPGSEGYWRCEVCEKIFSDANAENEIAGIQSIPATGHNWGTGVITTPASCTESGIMTYTCENDSSHTKTEPISAAGHKLVQVEAKDATCTEDGNREHWKCEVCEKLFADEAGTTEQSEAEVTISALGHDWTVDYVWASDNSSVTATATCSRDENHMITKTVTVGIVDGEYVAEFTEKPFETQRKSAGYKVTVTNYATGTQYPATITGIQTGEYAGEVTFTVACETGCVVAYSTDSVNYTRMKGTNVGENIYSFTLDVNNPMEVAIALKGDVTLDGEVKIADVTQINAAFKGKRTFTGFKYLVADINGDNALKIADVTQTNALFKGKRTLAW